MYTMKSAKYETGSWLRSVSRVAIFGFVSFNVIEPVDFCMHVCVCVRNFCHRFLTKEGFKPLFLTELWFLVNSCDKCLVVMSIDDPSFSCNIFGVTALFFSLA